MRRKDVEALLWHDKSSAPAGKDLHQKRKRMCRPSKLALENHMMRDLATAQESGGFRRGEGSLLQSPSHASELVVV